MKNRAWYIRCVVLVALVSTAFCAGGRSEARDFELRPTLTVGEEYTDNIFETLDGRKSEFTTRVRPGALLVYRTPRIVWDSAYTFDYRHYAKGTHEDEEFHNVDLKVNAQLLENFLYLDLSDTLQRTTVDVSRDVATESLLTDQTMQNRAAVSPYLLWRLSDKGILRTGYRYADTRYWEGSGIDKREHEAFMDFEHQLSARTTLYAAYTFASGDSSMGSYDRHDAMGGFKHLYADNSFLFARIGNSWQSFAGGARTSNLFWDAGVTHDFRVATAVLETKVQNSDDPLSVSTRQVSYSGRIDKAFDRGALGLQCTYAEYFIVQTDTLDERRFTINGSGRYDIMPRLALSAYATGDRFRVNSAGEYPYRLTLGAGLNYGFFNDNTALSLSYSYRTDRFEIDEGRGEKVTNRVLLEIRTEL